MAKVISDDQSPFNATGNATSERKTAGRPLANAEDWGPVFVGALMEGSSVKEAARVAGVVPSSVYRRRHEDLAFRRAWNEAADVGTRLLEQEAQRRAYHGTLEPVFHKGVECGYFRKYSDTLMIFLLKARRPDKYREGVEDAIHGNVVLNINVETIDKRDEVHLIDAPQALAIEVTDVGGDSK